MEESKSNKGFAPGTIFSGVFYLEEIGFLMLDAQYHEEILGSYFKFDDIVDMINNQLRKTDETEELPSVPQYGVVNLMFVKLTFEPNSTNSLHISHRVISGFSKNRSGTRINYMYEHQIDPTKYWTLVI